MSSKKETKPRSEWPFAKQWKRWARWAILGTAFGVFMLIKFAVIGKWLGALLVAYGIYCGVRVFLEQKAKPSGFSVNKQQVSLPRGRFSEGQADIQVGDIKHVFFLRKSAPLFLNKPVLVVETTDTTHLLPRDWFVDPNHQESFARQLWLLQKS